MAESTLYLDPRTGILDDAPTAGSLRISGAFTVGVTAPVVIYCHLHGRYEAHDEVARLGMRGRAGFGPLMFAKALLAAASGDCATYKKWTAGLSREVTAIISRPGRASTPTYSWECYARMISQRTPFHDALRALARMSLPVVAPSVGQASLVPIELNRATGAIERRPPERSGGNWQVLPKDSAWLVVPCKRCGFECMDTFALTGEAVGAGGAGGARSRRAPGMPWKGEIAPLSHDLAKVLAADGVRTCDEYEQRSRLLDKALQGDVDPNQMGPLKCARSIATAVVGVAEDIGWVVAEALSNLVDEP